MGLLWSVQLTQRVTETGTQSTGVVNTSRYSDSKYTYTHAWQETDLHTCMRAGSQTVHLHTCMSLIPPHMHEANSPLKSQRFSGCTFKNQFYCILKHALKSFNPQNPDGVLVRYPLLTSSLSKTVPSPSNKLTLPEAVVVIVLKTLCWWLGNDSPNWVLG